MDKKSKYTTNQIISKEGMKPLVLCGVLILLFIFLHLHLLAVIFFLVFIFLAFIFRNPERLAEYRNEDMIIAPCDGIIKDVSMCNNATILKIHINLFDVGILRNPMFVDNISAEYKYGLFITNDDNLKEILNTKHCINGIKSDKIVYNITILPEMWNKVSIYDGTTTFAGDRLGFMKYGYLILYIYTHCNIKVEKGHNIFAGQTLLGKLL